MTEHETSSPFTVLLEQLEKGRFDHKEAQFFFKIGLAVKNKEITPEEENRLTAAWRKRGEDIGRYP